MGLRVSRTNSFLIYCTAEGITMRIAEAQLFISRKRHRIVRCVEYDKEIVFETARHSSYNIRYDDILASEVASQYGMILFG
ncbi:unnamed protein product [Gongylonema pulchrum]|uniref:Transposase n=1 Tax=Gongylonema pulchrum TaxID=637853 RepID=A0A183DPT9_9BILA|nr:unnamed protein product [Gongylonema pulchrum]